MTESEIENDQNDLDHDDHGDALPDSGDCVTIKSENYLEV